MKGEDIFLTRREQEMFAEFNKIFKRGKGGELTSNVTADLTVTPELFQKLIGQTDEKKYTMTFTTTEPICEYVPVRKHRKKRIQKKWIKRYGYKAIQVGEKQVEKSIENVRLFTHGEFPKDNQVTIK